MKDSTTELYAAVYSMLNGNLSYGGSDYPVYSSVPKSANYNYVVLADVTFNEDGAQDTYISDCTMLIDIVTGGFKNRGTKKPMNSISNQILQLLVGQNISMTNFTISVHPHLINANEIEEITEVSIIYRKLLRLRFTVQQT